MPIAASIFVGGSFASTTGSFLENQVRYGTFSPVCRKVPIDAHSSINHTSGRCDPAADSTIIVLLTKPLNNGTPDMENAPII